MDALCCKELFLASSLSHFMVTYLYDFGFDVSLTCQNETEYVGHHELLLIANIRHNRLFHTPIENEIKILIPLANEKNFETLLRG